MDGILEDRLTTRLAQSLGEAEEVVALQGPDRFPACEEGPALELADELRREGTLALDEQGPALGVIESLSQALAAALAVPSPFELRVGPQDEKAHPFPPSEVQGGQVGSGRIQARLTPSFDEVVFDSVALLVRQLVEEEAAQLLSGGMVHGRSPPRARHSGRMAQGYGGGLDTGPDVHLSPIQQTRRG